MYQSLLYSLFNGCSVGSTSQFSRKGRDEYWLNTPVLDIQLAHMHLMNKDRLMAQDVRIAPGDALLSAQYAGIDAGNMNQCASINE